jgi:hypothetical protein
VLISSLCLGICLTAINSEAAGFKGYTATVTPSEKKVSQVTFKESISRYEETSDEFLIAFSRHAAFYRFPKKKDLATQFQRFLKDRIASKRVIIAEVNPVTTEIYSIRDL